MELTFAIEGGTTVVGACTSAALSESIGAWLPRLVSGRHQGWREVNRENAQRGIPQEDKAIPASYCPWSPRWGGVGVVIHSPVKNR
jgi:hypothetical protein